MKERQAKKKEGKERPAKFKAKKGEPKEAAPKKGSSFTDYEPHQMWSFAT